MRIGAKSLQYSAVPFRNLRDDQQQLFLEDGAPPETVLKVRNIEYLDAACIVRRTWDNVTQSLHPRAVEAKDYVLLNPANETVVLTEFDVSNRTDWYAQMVQSRRAAVFFIAEANRS